MKNDIKKFGFGMMRLPKIGEEFDKEQIIKMIDLFLENGYNYFDTSYAYEGSEEIIGELLSARHPREKFVLASKLPVWSETDTEESARKLIDISLERCKVDYFDYYMLHNVGGGRTKRFNDFKLWDYISELKAKGVVKKIGFSFHDNAKVLEEILSAHPEIDFVQLQINYTDWENSQIQSKACYEVAQKYNMPVIIMEPLKGGFLANPPQKVKDELDKIESKKSYPEYAFKFCNDLDNIITILSGVSTIEQMEENLKIFNNIEKLSDDEKIGIKNAQESLKNSETIPCTSCSYCMSVCPEKIVIQDVFRAHNTYLDFEDLQRAKGTYGFTKTGGGDPAGCIKCGKCNDICPQKIDVITQLEMCVEKYS